MAFERDGTEDFRLEGAGVCDDTCSDASDRLARVLLDAEVEAPSSI